MSSQPELPHGDSEASPPQLKLAGRVGFDTMPNQLVKKVVANGFAFNILCVGETGLGKSTLMDTLFNTRFQSTPAPHDLPGVQVKTASYELVESSVKLRLTVIDSVGFGDQINKEDSSKPIIDYIDAQFEAYLQEELKIERDLQNYRDTRVHCCLYFIAPTGHSLKSLDLVTMKRLDSKVNIIPIIAKADTITKSELNRFKQKIMSELQNNNVQIYRFPTDDDTIAELNKGMNGHIPFAVVGSSDEVKVGNSMVRARQFPWGTVQVENENHCDFIKLREMLINTNLHDLVDATASRHYELFRRSRLLEMGFNDSETTSLKAMESLRAGQLTDLQQKENDMRQMFVIKVKEKEAELKEREKEIQTKYEHFKRQHELDKTRLADERRKVEDDIKELDKRKQAVSSFLEKTRTKPRK